jgi:hypothetical protein
VARASSKAVIVAAPTSPVGSTPEVGLELLSEPYTPAVARPAGRDPGSPRQQATGGLEEPRRG